MLDVSFRSWFYNLKNLYIDAKKQANTIEEAYKQAQEDYKKTKATETDETKLAFAEYRIRNARDTYEAEMNALRGNVSAKSKEYIATVEKLSKEHFRINPDKLDANVVKMIEMGAISVTDLEQLADTHKNNTTMLRVIKQYAEKINAPMELTHRLAKALDEESILKEYRTLDSLGWDGIKDNSDTLGRRMSERLFEEQANASIDNASPYAIIEVGSNL